MTVASFTESFGLRCIACGAAPDEVLMLTAHAEDDPRRRAFASCPGNGRRAADASAGKPRGCPGASAVSRRIVSAARRRSARGVTG